MEIIVSFTLSLFYASRSTVYNLCMRNKVFKLIKMHTCVYSTGSIVYIHTHTYWHIKYTRINGNGSSPGNKQTWKLWTAIYRPMAGWVDWGKGGSKEERVVWIIHFHIACFLLFLNLHFVIHFIESFDSWNINVIKVGVSGNGVHSGMSAWSFPQIKNN